jgi:hypothetical protein
MLLISVASTAASPLARFSPEQGIRHRQCAINNHRSHENTTVTDTPRTNPVSLRLSDDLPPSRVRAPGVQEETIVRFDLPASVSQSKAAAGAERLVEELQVELETVWRMSALLFATVQRIAHDQAEIVGGVFASLTRAPLARANPAGEARPSPVFPPDAGPIVTDGIIRSFGEIAGVTGESYRELLDIQTGRLLTWVSTLQTISGWSGPDRCKSKQ